jgi:hypothetical protein
MEHIVQLTMKPSAGCRVLDRNTYSPPERGIADVKCAYTEAMKIEPIVAIRSPKRAFPECPYISKYGVAV